MVRMEKLPNPTSGFDCFQLFLKDSPNPEAEKQLFHQDGAVLIEYKKVKSETVYLESSLYKCLCS